MHSRNALRSDREDRNTFHTLQRLRHKRDRSSTVQYATYPNQIPYINMSTYTTSWARALYMTTVIVALALISGAAFAQLRPNFGSASTYALFTGGGAINNTGNTRLTGDVGQDGAYSFNGFPPGTYTGTLNRNNGATALAKSDLLAAWTTEAAVPCNYVLGVGIVDGQSFDPGVYCSGAATTTTGNITFNAHGNANAIFIVKIGGQLDANSGTHILLANNARAANIYWFVDGAVNVADNSSIKGTIFARGAISFAGTSSLDGRALAAPAGAITLSANNMAISTDSGSANNLTIVRPASGDSIKGGTLRDTITWAGSGIARVKTLEYSLDSGITWTTIATFTTDSFTYVWAVPDTSSTKAMVRLTDTNNMRGVSGRFTITSTKILVIRPATGASIARGTQNYQITWSGVGLTPKKTISLSLDSGLTWTTIGIISSNLFTYSWNVPDTVSTRAMIRITDSNGVTGKSGLFTIRSSAIVVTHPSTDEVLVRGTSGYQITWTGVGLTPKKTFELSLDSGATWTTIGAISTNAFTYSWNVPDTTSTRAMIRITDSNGVTGKSGRFTIRSTGIVITHPNAGEVLVSNTPTYQITWTGVGIAPRKTFELSLDGGLTWRPIGTLTADVTTYYWYVPDTASTQAVIRITDSTGMTGKSGIFTIQRSKTLMVVNPALGEVIAAGMQAYQITWTGSSLTPPKTFELSLDNGRTWTLIGSTSTNGSTYSWNVPDTVSTQAKIRITNNDGSASISAVSGTFSISRNVGSIIVVHPVAGEVLDGGYQNFPVTFTASNVTLQKTLEYSLDGGITWSLIGVMNSDAQTYNWASVPNVATTRALLRIRDANGITGTSGLFTITVKPNIGTINQLILSGLNQANNIGNNQQLGITWTFTPDIGTWVEVEYSLDYMVTWSHIATVVVTESPNSTAWLTPSTGFYNPVFIRVTSSKGMTRLSSAFSIGTNSNASVTDAVQSRYDVTNYPNPASDQTTFRLTLPQASDVSLTVIDALGREVGMIGTARYAAGPVELPFNTSALRVGNYLYILHAGATTLTGKLSIH